MKQILRIRYKTEDNPPMANVPLIGYSLEYDCKVALVYRKGDNYQDMFYAGRDIYYFKGIGGHGITDLLRNAIDDLLDTISSRETYRSAEHRMYAQMNRLTEAGAMISLAIELITSNIRRNYGEINFERYPRPVEVEGEDKH
jgi:hypothetical protein